MSAQNISSLLWSKTVRDHVIAFVLPVIAIAAVLAVRAANGPWTGAHATGCAAVSQTLAAHTADLACRRN